MISRSVDRGGGVDPTGRRRIWGRKRVVYEGADRQSAPDQRPKKTRCYFRVRWEEWVESRILSLLPLPRKYSVQWGRAGLLVSLKVSTCFPFSFSC